MEKIAILDCGGQYTKVIDRKVRELGTYTDIFPIGTDIEKLRDYNAFILSGGPSSVWSEDAIKYNPALLDMGKPVLGICYGMQLINEHFGGKVSPEVKTEYGQIIIDVDPTCPLFSGLTNRQAVLMSHGDAVTTCASDFKVVASTDGVVAGIYNEEKKIIGVQFHPEVDPTENGIKMLENFIRNICGLKEVYALEDRIQTSIDMIRRRVGDQKVVVLVSGGVDSAVTAALLVKALPAEKVFAIHIDHGLMRKNESDLICENLHKLGLVNMQRVNAEDEFFNHEIEVNGKVIGPLSKTSDPETKRQIIGSMFIKVTKDAVDALGIDFDNTFLAQGTLRPDLIESGNPDVSGYANKIKTHHNDVDIVRAARARGMIIETNWDWHKDEVRQVARILGLDEAIAGRQPFPGPGLGVRLICCNEAIPLPPENRCKDIADFVSSYGSGNYSVKLGPIQSVGVQGDHRSYKTLATLYTTSENIDWNEVMQLAKEIPNRYDFVNRVAIRVDSKACPKDTECKGLHICRETADILREVDSIVTENIMNPTISQCFAVLFPYSEAGKGEQKYSVAIRAVVTRDFMTAKSAVPGVDFSLDALDKTVKTIKEKCGEKISMVFYDVTGKPPATVEWE